VAASWETHKHKVNFPKFIPQYLPIPLFLPHINKKTKYYMIDYILDILI